MVQISGRDVFPLLFDRFFDGFYAKSGEPFERPFNGKRLNRDMSVVSMFFDFHELERLSYES